MRLAEMADRRPLQNPNGRSTKIPRDAEVKNAIPKVGNSRLKVENELD
jgi:hypothetical protein